MTIKYLLDENLPPIYREQLLYHLPDLTVFMVGDPATPIKGTKDPEILILCELNNFILVTNNRRSMPQHLIDHLSQNCHIPGILAIRFRAEMGKVINDLIAIAVASFEGEYQDQIIHIPLR